MNKDKAKLISKLRNKEYRDAFVSEHIDTGIPFQIQALREQRGWTQKELGKRAGMQQTRISLLEDPNYGKLTLTTLKKLASAFDIGLMVRFVPYSELLGWELRLSLETLKVKSFEEESYFKEKVEVYGPDYLQELISPRDNLILFDKKCKERQKRKYEEAKQPVIKPKALISAMSGGH